jgi:hypothetical protein
VTGPRQKTLRSRLSAVAGIPLRLLKPGVYRVSVRAAGAPGASVATQITVVPAAATRWRLRHGTYAPGGVLHATVAGYDPFGNLDTLAQGSVRFRVTIGATHLSRTVPLRDGVATLTQPIPSSAAGRLTVTYSVHWHQA